MTRIVNGEIVRDDASNHNNEESSGDNSNGNNGNFLSYFSEKISFFGYQIPKYSLFFIGLITMLLFGFSGLFGLGLLAGCHYLYTSNSSGNTSTNGVSSTGYQPVNRNNNNGSGRGGGGARITTISDLPKPPPKG